MVAQKQAVAGCGPKDVNETCVTRDFFVVSIRIQERDQLILNFADHDDDDEDCGGELGFLIAPNIENCTPLSPASIPSNFLDISSNLSLDIPSLHEPESRLPIS